MTGADIAILAPVLLKAAELIVNAVDRMTDTAAGGGEMTPEERATWQQRLEDATAAIEAAAARLEASSAPAGPETDTGG